MDEQTKVNGTGGGWASVALAVDEPDLTAGLHEEAVRWIARHPAVRRVRVVGRGPGSDPGSAAVDGAAAAIAAARGGNDVAVEVARGPVSARDDVDCIVVGSRRASRGTANTRAAARLAERSTVPVVVVPDVPHLVDGDVVLAVGEPLDERALALAAGEARSRHKRLTLVRAWEMPVLTRTGLTDFAEDPLRWRRAQAEVLDRATERVRSRHPELRVAPLLVEGHPGRAIAAHSRHASLVVLGQGHVHVVTTSVLHDLLRWTHAPVCVVPSAVPGPTGRPRPAAAAAAGVAG